MQKLKIYFVFICVSSVFLTFVNLQKVQYVSRFRNFSIESETGDIYLINHTIYQHNMDHVLACSFNITKDFWVKSATVVTYRCTFENAACENFQEWVFDGKMLKSVMYMKNQTWTPLYSNITPKLDPPNLKKGFYQTTKAGFDANAALVFYPEVMKYFWRYYLILVDANGKKAATFLFETSYFTFVERDRKRERKGLTDKS